jgi:hypothetical protein
LPWFDCEDCVDELRRLDGRSSSSGLEAAARARFGIVRHTRFPANSCDPALLTTPRLAP